MASESNRDFIGREDELAWLRLAWTLARNGKPCVRILRGESGFGKTRIVQTFYAWLSVHPEYDAAGYWPDRLLTEGSNIRLNPPAEAFGEAGEIPWLWWGVRWSDTTAHNRGELSSCALIDGLMQLEPHRQALGRYLETLRRAGKAGLELGAVAGELLTLGAFGAAKSLGELILLWREERGAKAREKLTTQELQDAALREQTDRLFGFLRDVLHGGRLHSGMPVVLVLDDAHWIDARSIDLVERLLHEAAREGWPLLVLVTHWEQDWNLLALDGKGKSIPAMCARLAETEHGAPDIEVRDIDRLAGLERLLLDALPGLAPEQVRFVCARADGNPRLMKEIILELVGEPDDFEERRLDRPLREDSLDALKHRSFALHEVQRRRFSRLDEEIRRTLGYASHMGMRFLRDLAAEVAAEVRVADGVSAAGEDAACLASAVRPFAVLADDDPSSYEFRHRVFHDLAHARLLERPRVERQVGEALLRVARNWLHAARDAAMPVPEREQFYLLILDQAGHAAEGDEGVNLALGRLLLHYEETGHYLKAASRLDAYAASAAAGWLGLGFYEQVRLVNLAGHLSC